MQSIGHVRWSHAGADSFLGNEILSTNTSAPCGLPSSARSQSGKVVRLKSQREAEFERMSGSYLLNWIRTIGFLFENSRIEIRPNTDLQTNLELSPDEPPTLTSLRELPGLDRN